MHIVILTQYFSPEIGAPQTRLGAMARIATAKGHHVTVVTAMPSYPTDRIFDGYRGSIARTEHIDGVTIRRGWSLPALGTGVRRMASYGTFGIAGFLQLLAVRRPDVLVIESPPLTNALTGHLWAAVKRVPVVFNVADLWPDAVLEVGGLSDGRILRLLYRLERWAYRRSTVVSTVTDGVAARLVTEKHVPPERLLMVQNGVDTDLFRPDAGDRQALDALELPDEPFIAYAGTMSLAHGIDELIEAFISLAGDTGTPHLLMLGSGSERARLEQRVTAAKVGNIHFRDPVPPATLAKILPLAMAGVVTMAEIPLNESTRPAKMFPLQASGLAVLYAGSGEGARILEESRGGLVVRNERTHIAAAVRDFAHRDDLHELGARGRQYVQERWSWDGIVAHWLERLSSLS